MVTIPRSRADVPLYAIAAVTFVATAATVVASPVALLLFVGAFALFTAPGWPLAKWFAGDDCGGIAKFAIAVVLGYAAGSLIFACLRLLTVTSPAAILLACVAIAAVLSWLLRGNQPGLIAFATLSRGDTIAVVILLVLAALNVGPAFARVGQRTAEGLAYRAYFTADLFAHMGVVVELLKGETPPINPFYPREPLPYYWTYFSFPTVFASLRPDLMVDRGILLADIVAAFVFVIIGFFVTRSVGASTAAAVTGWIVVLVASSFEGIFFVGRQLGHGQPVGEFRNFNIDATTRWLWDAPPIDGLHRIMWYTPQHEMAITLGLILLASMVVPRGRDGILRGIAEGFLLASAFAFSSFNGLLLIGWYALTRVGLAIRARVWRRSPPGAEGEASLPAWIAGRVVAAAIVLGVLALTVALGMIQRNTNEVVFRPNLYFLKGPWAFIFLSFGPALFLAPLGIRRLIRQAPATAMAFAVLTAICVFTFLRIEIRGHENTYIPFRTAQLFFLVLAILLAFALDASRAWRPSVARAFWILLFVFSVAAAPTVAFDWYNTRDITNVEPTPGGFPWTVHITEEEQAAAVWIQRNIPESATIQIDASSRGRASWELIPVFARRHMAVGFGLFEPNPTRFDRDIARVRVVYRTPRVEEAYGYCQRMGIDYIYVGDAERKNHGTGIDKFGKNPKRFQRVFSSPSIEIYKALK